MLLDYLGKQETRKLRHFTYMLNAFYQKHAKHIFKISHYHKQKTTTDGAKNRTFRTLLFYFTGTYSIRADIQKVAVCLKRLPVDLTQYA